MGIDPRWLRPLIAAMVTLPLLTFVLLSAPAWLTWPFLSEQRRQSVLDVIEMIVTWTRVIRAS